MQLLHVNVIHSSPLPQPIINITTIIINIHPQKIIYISTTNYYKEYKLEIQNKKKYNYIKLQLCNF